MREFPATNGTSAAVRTSSSLLLLDFISATFGCHRAQRGLQVVRAEAPSLPAWTAASVVLLDERTLTLCLQRNLPARTGILLVTAVDSDRTPWCEAARISAQGIYCLPLMRRPLAAALEAADNVLAVVGSESFSGRL